MSLRQLRGNGMGSVIFLEENVGYLGFHLTILQKTLHKYTKMKTKP